VGGRDRWHIWSFEVFALPVRFVLRCDRDVCARRLSVGLLGFFCVFVCFFRCLRRMLQCGSLPSHCCLYVLTVGGVGMFFRAVHGILCIAIIGFHCPIARLLVERVLLQVSLYGPCSWCMLSRGFFSVIASLCVSCSLPFA